ncbi:MAG: pseudomurein-binding repeat-containing protein, partial [Methanobacteriaceae archaeon]
SYIIGGSNISINVKFVLLITATIFLAIGGAFAADSTDNNINNINDVHDNVHDINTLNSLDNVNDNVVSISNSNTNINSNSNNNNNNNNNVNGNNSTNNAKASSATTTTTTNSNNTKTTITTNSNIIKANSTNSVNNINSTASQVSIKSSSAKFTATGKVVSISSIISAAISVKNSVNKNGVLPNYITINGTKYSMPQFLYLLSKAIVFINTNPNSTNSNSANLSSNIVIRDFADPIYPEGDSINATINKTSFSSLANSIIYFMDKNNRAPDYLSSSYGKIQYQSVIWAFSRILAFYGDNNNTMPNYIDLKIQVADDINCKMPLYVVSGSGTSKMAIINIIDAANRVNDYLVKYGKLPNSIKIAGDTYSMPQFLYFLSGAIVYINKYSKYGPNTFVNGSVAIKNLKNPSKATGTNIIGKFYKSRYVSMASKIISYMNKYGKAPNYNAISLGKSKYQTTIYSLTKILDSFYHKKALPSYISLKVKKNSKVNNYLPNYVRLAKGNNAIWLWSSHMKQVSFKTLSDNNVGNIFLLESAFSLYGTTSVKNWIAAAKKYGLKVHIWVTCFYKDGNWVNPMKKTDNGYVLDSSITNPIISKIKTYTRISGVAGIHLDYVRFPGTAYKYDGTKGITQFVSKVVAAVKAIKKSTIVSAAVMPETNVNGHYYGQEYSQMGKYLDVLCPMIYSGNYEGSTTWITKTTQYIVKNSPKAKVWVGLQGYYADENPVKLPVATLKKHVQAVISGKAAGVALFRWGLTNFFKLSSL